MKVTRDLEQHMVSLSQQSYIENLVERFGLQDAQTVTTPLAPGTILTKDQCPKTQDEINDMTGSRYRELIGSLQYASLATRPDITYAVNKLSQFLSNPGRVHLDAALRVLRYLNGTKHRSLHLGGGIPDVAGFSDSDWGGDHDDRKSTGAYVFRLGLGSVSWKSKKQTSVALSTVESEYMAMCQAAKEAVWLNGLLEDLGVELRTPLIIYGDNQGALALAQNPDFHPRSKHIDIQYHFTRELSPCRTYHYQVSPHQTHDRRRAHEAAPSPCNSRYLRKRWEFIRNRTTCAAGEGECWDIWLRPVPFPLAAPSLGSKTAGNSSSLKGCSTSQ
jgi:hypothetical protein